MVILDGVNLMPGPDAPRILMKVNGLAPGAVKKPVCSPVPKTLDGLLPPTANVNGAADAVYGFADTILDTALQR